MNIENRIRNLEKRVTNLLKRTRARSMTSVVTPYPISNAIFGEDVSGVFLRYMFSANGELSNGYIRLGTKPKEGVVVSVRVFNEESSASKEFVLTKKVTPITIHLPVVDGGRLEVSVTKFEGEAPITEIWAALQWIINVTDAYTKSFLIKDLENAVIEE